MHFICFFYYYLFILSLRLSSLQRLKKPHPLQTIFIEVLLKTSIETRVVRFWGKYQVQLQKVTDIRWVSLRKPGPYYRHWPVKYHIACEHAQQNDAIWEDVTSHPQVTPSWHRGRGGVFSENKELSLPLWWFSQYGGKEIPSETRASEHVLFPKAFGHVYSLQWDTREEGGGFVS